MKPFRFLAQALVLTACVAVFGAEQPANEKDLFKQYMEKFGPPGPEHKFLEPLVGTWHANCKLWTEPGGKPLASEGTLVRKSIFDGRFVHEDFNGKIMDKPYEGHGTIGFDRAKQKFVTTWIDSMGTGVHISYGTYDESAKTWTFRNEVDCPITKKRVKTRDTLRIVSQEEQLLEMYRQMGEEKEFRMMEIQLTRKK